MYLVFLVLARIREDGNDCSDALSRGILARVDHDEKLHQVVIHVSRSRSNDEHVISADGHTNLYTEQRPNVNQEGISTRFSVK